MSSHPISYYPNGAIPQPDDLFIIARLDGAVWNNYTYTYAELESFFISSGADLVAAIDAELGNSTWQEGGGGLSTEVTVTVPALGRYEHEETVAFVGCTPSSKVFAALAPTLDSDENGAETLTILSLVAAPGVDVVTVYLAFATSTGGPIKLILMAV